MDKIQLFVCKECNKIILSSKICSNCLNKVDVIDVDIDRLDIRLIEYTKSMINNDLMGLMYIRFDDMSIQVLGKIDKPSSRFRVKEWKRLEFTAI